MAGLNKMTIIGHLGKDPEIRYLPDGLAVTNFSVAVSEKAKGEEKVLWFRVAAFGKLGEICGEYLSKGKQVYVDGRLQVSEWKDKDGNKRFNLEIIANTVQMLGTKSDNQPAQTQAPPPPQQTPRSQVPRPGGEPPQAPAPKIDDDIPF